MTTDTNYDDADISPRALLLLYRLVHRCDYKNATIHSTRAHLAELCGLSEGSGNLRNIKRYLEELVNIGVIKHEARSGGDGGTEITLLYETWHSRTWRRRNRVKVIPRALQTYAEFHNDPRIAGISARGQFLLYNLIHRCQDKESVTIEIPAMDLAELCDLSRSTNGVEGAKIELQKLCDAGFLKYKPHKDYANVTRRGRPALRFRITLLYDIRPDNRSGKQAMPLDNRASLLKR